MPGSFTKAAVLLAAGAAFAAALANCGGTTNETPAADAGTADVVEAATDTGVTDAASEAASEAAATCDLGTLPTMPSITSEVVIDGLDGGGAAPAATGGDESGNWVYRKITLYLPSQAAGQVDPAESKIEGKGFIDLGGGKFRQFVDTTTTLSTSIVGKVTRAGTSKVLGTYTINGATTAFTITCRESTGETASLGDVGFSRVDATHGRLHVKSSTQLGTANLVIDLEKAP